MKELLFKKGAYKTPASDISLLSGMLPSFSFYSKLFWIVLKSSSLAKRSRYDTKDWAQSSLEVLRALESVGIKFIISGLNHVKSHDGPCVFVANHMSSLETMTLPAIIAPFKDLTFVVKKSLVDYPVFRHVMRSRDPITVSRTNPREDLKTVLEGGTQRLMAGRSIVIFPQSVRVLDVDPKNFGTIGIKLAKKAGVPIIPVALKTDAWGNGKYLKDYGKIAPSKAVYFEFGAPIFIKGRGNEEHDEIIEFIAGRLMEWEE